MAQQISGFKPTQEQRDWIDNKKKKTQKSHATILRDLIDKEIQKDKRGK